jgi:hypothetical protein
MVNRRKVQQKPRQGKQWQEPVPRIMKEKDAIAILLFGWIIGMLTACIVIAISELLF